MELKFTWSCPDNGNVPSFPFRAKGSHRAVGERVSEGPGLFSARIVTIRKLQRSPAFRERSERVSREEEYFPVQARITYSSSPLVRL